MTQTAGTQAPDTREVSFTRMDQGTSEDFAIVMERANAHLHTHLVDTLLDMLRSMRGDTLGYKIDRYEHSLQTATRALRDDARIDMVVAALLHDIGDTVAPANHSELAAAILEPYLDEESVWVVRHHGVFQGYHYWDKLGLDRNARERYRGSPYFDATAYFCAQWDQLAFDPAYESLPLEAFEPMVREVFARPANGFRDPNATE